MGRAVCKVHQRKVSLKWWMIVMVWFVVDLTMLIPRVLIKLIRDSGELVCTNVCLKNAHTICQSMDTLATYMPNNMFLGLISYQDFFLLSSDV